MKRSNLTRIIILSYLLPLLALADEIKRSVFDFSGLELDIEPRVYGLE